jgi:hypothetical protein
VIKRFQSFFENLAKFSEVVKIFLQNIPSLFFIFCILAKFRIRKKNVGYEAFHITTLNRKSFSSHVGGSLSGIT